MANSSSRNLPTDIAEMETNEEIFLKDKRQLNEQSLASYRKPQYSLRFQQADSLLVGSSLQNPSPGGIVKSSTFVPEKQNQPRTMNAASIHSSSMETASFEPRLNELRKRSLKPKNQNKHGSKEEFLECDLKDDTENDNVDYRLHDEFIENSFFQVPKERTRQYKESEEQLVNTLKEEQYIEIPARQEFLQGVVENSQKPVHIQTKKRRLQGGFRTRRFKLSGLQRETPIRNPNKTNEKIDDTDYNIQDGLCTSTEGFDSEELNDRNEDLVDVLSVKNNNLDVESYVQQCTEYQKRKEKHIKKFLENIKEYSEEFVEVQHTSKRRCDTCNCAGDNKGLVFCDSGCGFVCYDCDVAIHSSHIHSRFFHGTKLDHGLSSNGTRFDVILDLGISKHCKNCDVTLQLKKLDNTFKVLKLSGVFLVNRSIFECPNCGTHEKYSLSDFWSYRLFPLNCDPDASEISSFDVLDQWKTLKNVSPVTTAYSYIQCLCEKSLNKIDQMKFDSMYQQYQRIQLHIDVEIFGINDFECIAKLSCDAVHMDGILKCKHLKLNQNECDESLTYYGSMFFVPDSEVEKVTEYCVKKKLCSKKAADLHCGPAKWKAASNAVKTKYSPVDVKGLQLVSCTHLINIGACNLLYGELFANNLLLIRRLMEIYKLEVGGSDVACKFGTWLIDKVFANPEVCKDLNINTSEVNEMKILLGDLHSKGHSLDCRICFSALWNDVGRLQGLEMQEGQNNPFSRGRHRTAFQTLNRRQDEFSELALFINKKRNKDMIYILIKRLNRITKEIDDWEKKLKAEEKKENLKITEDTINRVKQSALNMRCKAKSDIENEIEVLSLSVMVKKMQLKTTYDPGQKQKVIENLKSSSKKLGEHILNNNCDPSKPKLDFNECLNGIFPWTAKLLPTEAQSKPSKFIELCELFLKIKNSVKEIVRIDRDVRAILENRITIIQKLSGGCELFSDVINEARAEKQIQLLGNLIDEFQAIKESNELNIDTEVYLQKLDLENIQPIESESSKNPNEKIISEAEEALQELIISESQLDDVLTDILTMQ